MKDYCLNLVNRDKYRFPCPKCNINWEYLLVRHVARFDDKTRSTIEKKLAENYMRQAHGCQQCPGCQTWCIPANHGDIRLQCDVCSHDLGRTYEFCWACQCQWKGTDFKCCGNKGCDGKDSRLRILNVAEKREIDSVKDCPSIRACPKCGLLINLTEGCRHMTCTTCNAEFCFICLSRWTGNGHLSRSCKVAPVQTQLSDPSWESRNDSWCAIL